MTTAAEVIRAVLQSGGCIWQEAGQLHVGAVPVELVPAIREHKATILAILAEVEAIQREAEQPPDPDPSGTAGVPWPDAHLAAARALLQAIREAGMYARIDDLGRLRVGPSSMVWDSDRRTIARYRNALVDILRAEGKP